MAEPFSDIITNNLAMRSRLVEGDTDEIYWQKACWSRKGDTENVFCCSLRAWQKPEQIVFCYISPQSWPFWRPTTHTHQWWSKDHNLHFHALCGSGSVTPTASAEQQGKRTKAYRLIRNLSIIVLQQL